jgi:hypothetical protein
MAPNWPEAVQSIRALHRSKQKVNCCEARNSQARQQRRCFTPIAPPPITPPPQGPRAPARAAACGRRQTRTGPAFREAGIGWRVPRRLEVAGEQAYMAAQAPALCLAVCCAYASRRPQAPARPQTAAPCVQGRDARDVPRKRPHPRALRAWLLIWLRLAPPPLPHRPPLPPTTTPLCELDCAWLTVPPRDGKTIGLPPLW